MKDFLGNDIVAGDNVIFRIGAYKGLVTGKVIFTDHKAHVELDTSKWMSGRPKPVYRIVYPVKPVDVYKI